MSQAEISIAWGLVVKYFGGDFNKAFLWWGSPNPLLGNISPAYMVGLKREKKLLKWVKQQILEETPDRPDDRGKDPQ